MSGSGFSVGSSGAWGESEQEQSAVMGRGLHSQGTGGRCTVAGAELCTGNPGAPVKCGGRKRGSGKMNDCPAWETAGSPNVKTHPASLTLNKV